MLKDWMRKPSAHLALLPHPLVEVVALGVEVKELEGVLENLLAFLAQLLEEGVAFLDGRLSLLDDVFPCKKKYLC